MGAREEYKESKIKPNREARNLAALCPVPGADNGMMWLRRARRAPSMALLLHPTQPLSHAHSACLLMFHVPGTPTLLVSTAPSASPSQPGALP